MTLENESEDGVVTNSAKQVLDSREIYQKAEMDWKGVGE